MLQWSNIKIGNIEARLPTYVVPPKEPKTEIDIVHWIPNPLYEKESDYEEDGVWYREKTRPNICYHKKCFDSPEHCVSIAFIRKEKDKYKFETIEHNFELAYIDALDFLTVVMITIQRLEKAEEKICSSM